MKNRFLGVLLALVLVAACVAVSVSADQQDVRDTFVCPCSDCVAVRKTDTAYTCPEASVWQSVSTTDNTAFADGGHYYVGTDTTCKQLILPAGTEAVLLIDNATVRYQGTARMISMVGTNDSTDAPITLHIVGNQQAGLQTKYTAASGTDGALVQVGAYETTHLRLYGDLTLSCEAGSTAADSGGLIKIPDKGRLYIHDNENMGLTNGKDPVLMGHAATSTSDGGGAVYMQSGQFHMEAGTIQGGSATYGGAVYVGAGTFNMSGTARITGATASYGGAVAVAGGTMNLKAGTITGCNATKYGGGVYTKGGKVNIGMDLTNYPDGPTITDCNATTRGGGMYIVSTGVVNMGGGRIFGNDTGGSGNGGAVYVRGESGGDKGIFNMSGGTVTGDSTGAGNSKGVRVQGGILNLSGTATIVSAGAKDTMAGVDCISGGQITLDGAAQVYTQTSKNAYDIMIRNSGSPLLTVKETWTGTAGVRILKILEEGTYAPGALLGNYGVSTGDYTGTLFLQGNSTLPRIYGKDGKLVFSAVQICDAGGAVWCKDNAEAVANVGSVTDAYILLYSNESLDLAGKEVAVDFNGHEVAVSGGILHGFDSTASTTPGTAKVTVTDVTVRPFVDAPVSGESFIATPQDGVFTFHKIKPIISGVNLRPESASMYYSGKVFYDESLARYIKDYGVAVQLREMPGEDFANTAFYTRTEGAPVSGDSFNGMLVKNIMKENADNSTRAAMPIYANAYVTVEVDGQTHTYLSSVSESAASMSLKEMVSRINTRYRYLDDMQKATINGLYTKFKNAMNDGTWKINYIVAAADPESVKPADSVIQQRRDMAEKYMREMATFMWRPDKDVFYTRDDGVLTEEALQNFTGTVLKLRAGKLYRGIPYSYSGSSAWNFYDFASEPDEAGIHTMSGIHWLNLNGTAKSGSIMGNDCSSSIQQSWDYAGSNIRAANTSYMVENYGYLRVGDYESSKTENVMTENTCKSNGIDVMSAAYSQLLKADAVVRRTSSYGHTMMIVENHPAMTADGAFDPEASYVTVLHQTTGYMNKEAKFFDPAYGEDVYITYGIDDIYTYKALFDQGYLPVTCDIFVNPAPIEETYVKDSETEFSYENILKGQFTSNRMPSAVTITITDESGKVVMEGTCYEHRQNHEKVFDFDLSWFTTRDALQQRGRIAPEELAPGKYHCTHVLRDAHGVNYTMRDFEFTVK